MTNTSNENQLSFFEHGIIWKDDERVIPNDVARSSIFTTRGKQKAREHYQNKEIFITSKDVVITYTGQELRAEDDEIVWLQLLHYLRDNANQNECINFTLYQLCKDLGWHINGAYYKKAESCLTRLQACALQIASPRHEKLESFSLVRRFSIEKYKTNQALCKVSFEPEITKLFVNRYYSRMEWAIYKDLKPISRRLFDYLSSHKEPFPLRLEVFKNICGSDTTRMSKWKEQVQASIIQIQTLVPINIYIHEKHIHFKKSTSFK